MLIEHGISGMLSLSQNRMKVRYYVNRHWTYKPHSHVGLRPSTPNVLDADSLTGFTCHRFAPAPFGLSFLRPGTSVASPILAR